MHSIGFPCKFKKDVLPSPDSFSILLSLGQMVLIFELTLDLQETQFDDKRPLPFHRHSSLL